MPATALSACRMSSLDSSSGACAHIRRNSFTNCRLSEKRWSVLISATTSERDSRFWFRFGL